MTPVVHTDLAPCHTGVLREALRVPMLWDILMGLRAWCRCRAGLPLLTHIGRARSQRRVQLCIFCEEATSNPFMHSLLFCAKWAVLRSPIGVRGAMTEYSSALRMQALL